MGRGRVLGASALLIIGVALVAATAETGAMWWALGGHLCLLLVPPLIFDAAVAASKGRQR